MKVLQKNIKQQGKMNTGRWSCTARKGTKESGKNGGKWEKW
jgi:hypothetical protein